MSEPWKSFVSLVDFEQHAYSMLPRNARDYYYSGACDMITLRENRNAYSRLQLCPRILRDVAEVDTTTVVFGQKISMPICVAPAAMQCMAHPDGEIATARACAKHSVIMGLSSLSTISIEDVSASAPSGLRWFQLYVYKDRAVTLDLVKRAERAGYKALAVTVDTPILGRREADVRNRFSLPSYLKLANLTSSSSEAPKEGSEGSGVAHYFSHQIDEALTWDDIAWLHNNCKLPIVLKGIITTEAALQAVTQGVAGIWVSNHGGRQLDTVPATINALRQIKLAVQQSSRPNIPLFMDGGIMRGTDVIKVSVH
jgi:(S)-2-hydroxy-acid oxidase